MKQQIPLNEIIVKVQPRKEFVGIESLADSIRQRGLLQPIIIDANKVLRYGERRYRACKFLGLEMVDVVFDTKEMPEDEVIECQLIENIERQSLTWQEEALGVLDIYRKKNRRGALEGWTWGQQQCANMFKMQIGTVNYILRVAKELEKELHLPIESRRYHHFVSAAEAFRLGILQDEEDRMLVIAAQKAKQSAEGNKQDIERATAEIVESITSTPIRDDIGDLDRQHIFDLRDRARNGYLDLSVDEARTLYFSNPLNPPDEFDLYYKEKRDSLQQLLTIDLSTTIIHGNCIEHMLSNPDTYDHIITDPPYGIDMSMLDQPNQGMVDIDRVVDAHDVAENVILLAEFIRAAWITTKESAFLIMCCDVGQWNHLYMIAMQVGWAVQRWPIVWRKVNQSIGNGAAQYNTSKDYEIIMVCRKPKSVLAQKMNTSIIEASNTEVTKLTGHPFAKPFGLTEQLVNLVSLPNQLLLEPFAGAGSMTIQALRMNRRVVAIEKELHHYNALVENIKNLHYLKLNPKLMFK